MERCITNDLAWPIKSENLLVSAVRTPRRCTLRAPTRRRHAEDRKKSWSRLWRSIESPRERPSARALSFSIFSRGIYICAQGGLLFSRATIREQSVISRLGFHLRFCESRASVRRYTSVIMRRKQCRVS